MDMKDNSGEFLKKMEARQKEESTLTQSSARRRVIHGGLRDRRGRFAQTVTGQDIRSPVSSSGDFSGKIDLGFELPGPSELASHEEGIQRRKQFSKDKKIPVPISIPLPKKRDGRPDTPPKRPGPIGR